jgi:hypothetical protein
MGALLAQQAQVGKWPGLLLESNVGSELVNIEGPR